MYIEFPPGVTNKRSLRSNKTNWRESNLIRWEGSTLYPVGGWEKLNYSDTASPIRAMHRWSANDGSRLIAVLCEEHCYVDTGSGTLLDITPDDGIAPPDVAGQGGFGDGPFGAGTFGTARDYVDRFEVTVPVFTLDNWGQELRVMTSSDGRLLGWDPDTPSVKLAAISNAPTQNRTFVVTDERHIILFGAAGEPAQFAWCDEEDDTEWTAGTTTKAGGFFVEPASPIMSAKKTPFGILMFTARSGYLISYIGLPYIYNYDPISESSPPYSPDAIQLVPDGAIWVALNGFWVYNGVTAQPIDCPVWDWITANINQSLSRYKSSMVTITTKFEIWWFFVSGEGNSSNNVVVIFNFKTAVWSMGYVGRSCGVSIPSDPHPLMAEGNSIYSHEKGFKYPGIDDKPWIESHTINTINGANIATLYQMLPEVIGDSSAIQFVFYKRNNPSSAVETVSSAKTVRSNGYVDVRETARDMRMRVEMVKEVDWSIGPIDFNIKKRGKK